MQTPTDAEAMTFVRPIRLPLLRGPGAPSVVDRPPHYLLQEIIGRGATSIVYRAIDPQQHVVAVKVIREELLVEAERPHMLERVAREARIGKLLNHPHLMRLLEWGEHNGMPYLVMDLLHGEYFNEVIRNRPLGPDSACAIISDVLDGLAYAHSRNIVHRDVKPANIVLRQPSADPVLMDFGIAHLAGSTLTQIGDLLGTPAYLAPEQLRGEPADHRADVFATGVTLYEAVVGRRPFEGSVAEVMRGILFDEPAPPSSFLSELAPLDPVLARSLAKDPSGRFPTAAAFAEALSRLAFAPETLISVRLTPAMVEHASDIDAIDNVERALGRAAEGGLDRDLARSVRELLAHIPVAEEHRVAELCRGRAFVAVADQLYATAPLPGRDPATTADPGDWSQLAQLAKELFEFGPRTSRRVAAEETLARLANALGCEILAYASDVGERLMFDEAPDLEVLAPALSHVEHVARCLGLFSAPGEQRLVEATLQLVAGQILRRAATFINRYARDGDPLARFDVVNMLFQSEDLIAITNRLLEDTALETTAGTNIIALRNVAALSTFLDAMSVLVGVSEELLGAELQSDDDNALHELVSHLRQVRLIYRFAARFDREEHGRQLALLVRRIYAMCARFGNDLIAMPASSPFLQQRLSALHDLADDLAWSELAAHLLARLRLLAVAKDESAVPQEVSASKVSATTHLSPTSTDTPTGSPTRDTRVIVVASKEGGSGKTTLAAHLAVRARMAEQGPVVLIDADPQGSLTEWWDARGRGAESLALVRTELDELGDQVAELRRQGVAFVIIDTPPALTTSIEHVIVVADLVLIPARPSPHDPSAVDATVEMIRRAEKPFLFVINGAAPRAHNTAEAVAALTAHGQVAPVILYQRTDFAASMADGRTVMEAAPSSRSTREIGDLWCYVEARIAVRTAS